LANEINRSLPFIKERGVNFCRGCLSSNLFSALDLGELPIANELMLSLETRTQKFPLHLRVCSDCGLGQVGDVVTPDRIFRDYRYLSSMSTTFLQHAYDFVDQQVTKRRFSVGDWVLEIASNDGYLLKNFLPHGIAVIGVEPAENVAEISRSLGIHTISEFFSSELANDLLHDYGFPKLIIANNVMAHVPDIRDFIRGLEILCGPETQISVENPTLLNILTNMQFDTIYHEHYSYLSASAVSKLSRMNNLQLFKVEEIPIHGGSNRYWIQKLVNDKFSETSVEQICNIEKDQGLFDSAAWAEYAVQVKKILRDFENWLKSAANGKKRVFGYGAAAKASTILNSILIESNVMLAIADLSLEKQHRFMPSHGIKIISPEELFIEEPTDIVIFPWNIKAEIAKYLRQNLGQEVRLWCAIPEMTQV
jgi:hypothetical protein